MADHGLSILTVEGLRERMEFRVGYFHYTDQCDGLHAGEVEFLEEVLADGFLDEEESSDVAEQFDVESAPVNIVHSWVSDSVR